MQEEKLNKSEFDNLTAEELEELMNRLDLWKKHHAKMQKEIQRNLNISRKVLDHMNQEV